jgi:hypothetical protein
MPLQLPSLNAVMLKSAEVYSAQLEALECVQFG